MQKILKLKRLSSKTANLFARANDHQNTVETLYLIDSDKLSDNQFVDYIFLLSDAQIALLSAETAKQQLNHPRFVYLSDGFNKSNKLRLLEVQSKLDFAQGEHYRGFQTLIELANSVKRKADIRDVHDKIWKRISYLPYSQLAEGTNHDNTILLAGFNWVRHCAINKVAPNSTRIFTISGNNVGKLIQPPKLHQRLLVKVTPPRFA